MHTENIENALKRAADLIHNNVLSVNSSEAQVKQAAILPVLRSLDWDDGDPRQFVPEYSVNEGRVDYALGRTVGGRISPLVFIEAKRLSGVNVEAEKQLFDYANHEGIPLLILTDGDIWDFYLSMAAGSPANRRFYRAVLSNAPENHIPKIAESFEAYLRKERVIDEKARRAAEDFHEGNLSKDKAKQALPGVWRSLLQEPADKDLRELLMRAVESECGTRPEPDDVQEFLGEQINASPASSGATPATPLSTRSGISPSAMDSEKGNTTRTQIVGYILHGQQEYVRSGSKTLAKVLETFHRRSSDFMPQFALKTRGRVRWLVAKNRDDLNNFRDLENRSMELDNGWWLDVNLTTKEIRGHICTACEVADICFGKDLQLIER